MIFEIYRGDGCCEQVVLDAKKRPQVSIRLSLLLLATWYDYSDR